MPHDMAEMAANRQVTASGGNIPKAAAVPEWQVGEHVTHLVRLHPTLIWLDPGLNSYIAYQ
jgi:hypothetical protein